MFNVFICILYALTTSLPFYYLQLTSTKKWTFNQVRRAHLKTIKQYRCCLMPNQLISIGSYSITVDIVISVKVTLLLHTQCRIFRLICINIYINTWWWSFLTCSMLWKTASRNVKYAWFIVNELKHLKIPYMVLFKDSQCGLYCMLQHAQTWL